MSNPNPDKDTNHYWGTAAFIGSVATLLVFMQVAHVWRRLDLFGKFEAAALITSLLLFPAGLFLNLKKEKPLSLGTVVAMAYILIMTTATVFGH